jgi:hypothetical protein
MNEPNLTQEEITPVYLAMLGKAAEAYHQRKDKMKQSFWHSSSTLSEFLPSTGEDMPPPITNICRMGDTKVIPPPTQEKEHKVVT